MEGIDPSHNLPMGEWSDAQVKGAVKEVRMDEIIGGRRQYGPSNPLFYSLRSSLSLQNVMLTWAPSKAKNNLPVITHGEGAYLYDSNGKKYIDWTSQAVCTNGGHTVSEGVKGAIMDQLDKVR